MFEKIKEMLSSLNVKIFEDVALDVPVPKQYIVYSESMTPLEHSDGVPIIWEYNIQLDVFENKENKKQLARKVKEILMKAGISFSVTRPIYYDDIERVQTIFEFTLT